MEQLSRSQVSWVEVLERPCYSLAPVSEACSATTPYSLSEGKFKNGKKKVDE